MARSLRKTGITFLATMLMLLGMMVPVHAEDAWSANTNTKSIYENDYDMGSLTVDDFDPPMISLNAPDYSSIIDKSTIVKGSGDGTYILKFSTPEEAYKAYGYYKSRNDYDFL